MLRVVCVSNICSRQVNPMGGELWEDRDTGYITRTEKRKLVNVDTVFGDLYALLMFWKILWWSWCGEVA